MTDTLGKRLDFTECPLCGRAFVGAAGVKTTCDDCKEEEQYLYDMVRHLIRDNDTDRHLTVEDAAKELHVPERKIRYLVEKGLIQLVPGVGLRHR